MQIAGNLIVSFMIFNLIINIELTLLAKIKYFKTKKLLI